MPFLILTLIIVANTLFSLYAARRQLGKLALPVPDAIKSVYAPDSWPRAVKYCRHKLVYSAVSEIFDTCRDILLLFHLNSLYAWFSKKLPILSPTVPFILFCPLVGMLSKIPFSAYFDFVIERKYGFNRTTLRTFITDIFLKIALFLVLGSPLLYTTFGIIRKCPRFEVFLCVFISLFQIAMYWAYPAFIAPLFNKFTPLESKSLADRLRHLADQAGFRLGSIEVMDGSKRSGHANAYFTGIGRTKKIVLYNTILEQLSEDEVVAVLSHELGHWYHSHTIKLLVIGCVESTGYILALKKYVGRDCSAVSFIEFMFALSALSIPLAFAVNSISRLFERQADRFAVSMKQGELLKSALVKLHTENLSAPVIDPLYSALNYTHPHLFERLSMIDVEMKKSE